MMEIIVFILLHCFVMIQSESASSTSSIENYISLKCVSENTFIDDINATYVDGKCLPKKCINNSIESIKRECKTKNNCLVQFPDCVLQHRHLNLSYVCNEEPDLSCNFELNACNWKADNFERKLAGNISSNDTTTNSDKGHLLMTSTNRSTLRSPTVSGKSVMCLTFYYKLSGNCRLEIIRIINGTNQTIGVSTSSSKTSQWVISKRSLYPDNSHYTIVITAIANVIDSFTVNIDDINFLHGDCTGFSRQEENFEKNTNTGTIVSPSKNKICPPTDHTTFTAEGHYLILASHHYKKQRSFQLSTNFQKNACLRFWYIMTGHSKFEVNLNEKPLVSPTSVYLSRNWLMYSVNVTLSGNESKLVFNGVMADQEGCAAIDDISLTTGYCRENRVNECFTAQSHQLQCKTVNIPDQRINILTKHTEDSSYDKYFENCQRFVNEFEKNIIQKCREQLFRRCVINRFAYSGDNCYEHLERVPQVMNIKYSCTENTTSPNVQTLSTEMGQLSTSEITYSYSSFKTSLTSFLTGTPTKSTTLTNQTFPITTMSQLYDTTEGTDETIMSSQGSSNNSGLIVGVILCLLFLGSIAAGLLCFLRRFNYLNNNKHNQIKKTVKIKKEMVQVSKKRESYVDLSIRDQNNDHLYQVTSSDIKPSHDSLDGDVYASIDDDLSIAQVNCNLEVPITNEYMSLSDERSNRHVRGSTHVSYSLGRYVAFDSSLRCYNKDRRQTTDGIKTDKPVYGYDRNGATIKMIKLGVNAVLDHTKYTITGPNITESVQLSIGNNIVNDYGLLDPNETGFDRSKQPNKEQSENYSVLDPKEAGLDRSKLTNKEQPEVYAVLDQNETGFYRSKLTTKEQSEVYAVLDPNETVFDQSKQSDEEHSEDYTVLDPNETGFDRSKLTTKEQFEDYAVLDPNEKGFNRSEEIGKEDLKCSKNDMYKFAQSFPSRTNNDEYTFPLEETYDKLGTNRNKAIDENVYSHSVDNVYDTTSHVHRQDKVDPTYDHFPGKRN